MTSVDPLNEPKIKAWKQVLVDAGCTINSITPISILYKKNGELLFGMVELDAADARGLRILPYALIRGNAVVIVPLLHNVDTGEEKFCMIYQTRVGNGMLNLEFPAGMLDRNIDDPASVAIRELHEETGIAVSSADLVLLHDKPLHTSAGITDEAIWFYGCAVKLDNKEYRSFEGRLAGEGSEDEHITVTLRTREQAEQESRCAQVILGFELFERARRSSRI